MFKENACSLAKTEEWAEHYEESNKITVSFMYKAILFERMNQWSYLINATRE